MEAKTRGLLEGGLAAAKAPKGRPSGYRAFGRPRPYVRTVGGLRGGGGRSAPLPQTFRRLPPQQGGGRGLEKVRLHAGWGLGSFARGKGEVKAPFRVGSLTRSGERPRGAVRLCQAQLRQCQGLAARPRRYAADLPLPSAHARASKCQQAFCWRRPKSLPPKGHFVPNPCPAGPFRRNPGLRLKAHPSDPGRHLKASSVNLRPLQDGQRPLRSEKLLIWVIDAIKSA